jgi:hypothetical protein
MSRGLWIPDAAELMTLLAQSRADMAAANAAIEELQENDAKNQKITRDLTTELGDKKREIRDIQFVRRKECAALESEKQKVMQQLDL